MGGGINVSSNSLILSLNLKFLSSMSIVETSSESSVTLWIEYNFDGNIYLISMVDRDFPFLFFKFLSKINFLGYLSNNAFCTEKVSSSKNISSWIASSIVDYEFSCICSSSSRNQIFSISTSKSMPSREILSLGLSFSSPPC
jgi:hypothetical protein